MATAIKRPRAATTASGLQEADSGAPMKRPKAAPTASGLQEADSGVPLMALGCPTTAPDSVGGAFSDGTTGSSAG